MRKALLFFWLSLCALGCKSPAPEAQGDASSRAPIVRVGSFVPPPATNGEFWTQTDVYVDPASGSNTNNGLAATTSPGNIGPLADFDELARRYGPGCVTFRQKTKIHVVSEMTSGSQPHLKLCATIANGGGIQVLWPQVTVATGGTLGTVTAKNRAATFPLLRANLGTLASAYAGMNLLDTTDSTISWVDQQGITGSSTTTANFTQPAVNGTVVVQMGDDTWTTMGSPITIGGSCQYLPINFQDSHNLNVQNTGTGTCPSPSATVTSGAAVAPLASNVTVLAQPYGSSISWATSGFTLPAEVNTITAGHGYSIVRPAHAWIDEFVVTTANPIAHFDDEYGLLVNADVQSTGSNGVTVLRGVMPINCKIETGMSPTSPQGQTANNFWVNDYFTAFPSFTGSQVVGGIITTAMTMGAASLDGDIIVHSQLGVRNAGGTSALTCAYLEGGGGPSSATLFLGYGSGVSGCSSGIYGPYDLNAATSGLIYWNDNGQTAAQAFGSQSLGLEINGTGAGWVVDRRISPAPTLGPRTTSIANLGTSIDSGGFLIPSNGSSALAVSDRTTGIVSETARFSQPSTTQAPLAGATYLPGPPGTCLESSDASTIVWGSCALSDAGPGGTNYQTMDLFASCPGPSCSAPPEPILAFAYNGPGSLSLVDQPTHSWTVVNLTVQAYTNSQINGASTSPPEPHINWINAQSVFDNPGNLSTDITFSNQVIEVNGTPVATRRQKLNVVASTGMTVTPSDNGVDTTTLTLASASGGTPFYQTVEANGAAASPQRAKVNFANAGGVTITTTDNGVDTTNVNLSVAAPLVIQNNASSLPTEPNLSFQGMDTHTASSTNFASLPIFYAQLDNNSAPTQSFTSGTNTQITFSTASFNLGSLGFGTLNTTSNASSITASLASGLSTITVKCDFNGALQTNAVYTNASAFFVKNGVSGVGEAFPIPGTGPGYAPVALHAVLNMTNGDFISVFGQLNGTGPWTTQWTGQFWCERLI